MEITTQQLKDIELITVKGRVDSIAAPQLAQALEAADRHGRHQVIMDLSPLEYMSSAGFRALNEAQRKSKRHPGGEVVLANVPRLVHEALELVGLTEYFHITKDVASALEYLENLAASGSVAGTQPVPAE